MSGRIIQLNENLIKESLLPFDTHHIHVSCFSLKEKIIDRSGMTMFQYGTMKSFCGL